MTGKRDEPSMLQDLTTGGVAGQLWRFSLPFMISNLLQILYNLVDMVVVGQFVGSTGLVAVSNGSEIMHLATTICIGFGSAGQILISQYVGVGSRDGIKKTIGTMFTLLSMASLVVMVLGLVYIEWIMDILRMPPEALEEATTYTAVCFVGMFFIFGYNYVSAVLRGMGDSKHPLLFIAIAAVSNLVLDLLFVAVLGMGVFGAALATVLGQALSFVTSLVFLYRHRGAFGFDFKRESFRMERKTVLALMKLGIPMALQTSAITISRLFVISWINSYGLVVSNVNGIGTKIGQCAMIVTQALSSACISMIGQSFAAGKLDRVKQVVYITFGWGLLFTGALSLLLIAFPEQIFGIFTTDEAVLAMSHDYVVIGVLSFMGFAFRAPMMGLMNGLGNAPLSMALGIFDGVVARIGLAIFLGVICDWGIMGFWYSNVIAGFIPFIGGGIYFWSGLWKKRKLAIL